MVAGAVENAGNAREAVAGEAFTDRLEDRDATGDRGLERQSDLVLFGQGREVGAVDSDHRLVGGDGVTAGRESGLR